MEHNPWSDVVLPQLPNTKVVESNTPPVVQVPEEETLDQLVSKATALQEVLLNAILRTEKSKTNCLKMRAEVDTLKEYTNNLVKAAED